MLWIFLPCPSPLLRVTSLKVNCLYSGPPLILLLEKKWSKRGEFFSPNLDLLCLAAEDIFFVLCSFFKKLMFLRKRERQSASGERTKREADTESEAGSKLWAASTEPDVGLELTDSKIMTWIEVRGLTEWATQVPLWISFLCTYHKLYTSVNYQSVPSGCWTLQVLCLERALLEPLLLEPLDSSLDWLTSTCGMVVNLGSLVRKSEGFPLLL